MSKPPYAVFEAVGFTEPVPGLRRRPVAVGRAAPIVERVEAGQRSATLAPETLEARRDIAPAPRGRAAPLATGVVLLAMAGAGWAMLQAGSKPALEIPPLTELAMPATPVTTALAGDSAGVQALSTAPVAEPALEKPTPRAETGSATPPAKPAATAPGRTAAPQPGQGDLLTTLPAPAAGQTRETGPATPPSLPSAMPASPPFLPAATPASAPAESQPERQPEVPAVAAPPQPPASAASDSTA